jgi:hypothetical protein
MNPDLISAVMREMGRKGGKKGGKKGAKMRMKALTSVQRSKIARKAAKARWAKSEKDSIDSPRKKRKQLRKKIA